MKLNRNSYQTGTYLYWRGDEGNAIHYRYPDARHARNVFLKELLKAAIFVALIAAALVVGLLALASI